MGFRLGRAIKRAERGIRRAGRQFDRGVTRKVVKEAKRAPGNVRKAGRSFDRNVTRKVAKEAKRLPGNVTKQVGKLPIIGGLVRGTGAVAKGLLIAGVAVVALLVFAVVRSARRTIA